MLDMWNKKIFIAKKLANLDKHGNVCYADPIEYEMNVQPTNSKNDVQEFGVKAQVMQKTVIERDLYENVFDEGDIAWLDEKNPKCDRANYRLLPPRNQNLCITIYFEKILPKGVNTNEG